MSELISKKRICDTLQWVADVFLATAAREGDNAKAFTASIVQTVKEHVLAQPAVDAVPVVRCRECVFRGSDLCPMCHDEYSYDEDDGGDYYTVDNTDDDGFCHKGKREV